MATYIQCLDKKISLSDQEVEKLLTVPFFKEVAQLEIGDTLDLNIKGSDFEIILNFIIGEPYQKLSTMELLRISKFASFYQIEGLILHCQSTIQNYFIESYEIGDLKKAHLLYFSGQIDIHKKGQVGLIMACANGHLTLAKWLFSFGIFDARDMEHPVFPGHWAFRIACKNGHFEVAKWLYSLGEIDIHADYENAFCISCFYGHLEIVQWLYSINHINPHMMDDYVYDSPDYIVEWLHLCGFLLE